MTPDLASAYDECRRISAAQGRSFYLATTLLPTWKRPYVHALYAFARVADDIVDENPGSAEQAATSLDALEHELISGDAQRPVVAAVRDTIDRWQIPPGLFSDFLSSMRADLHVTSYRSWDDLLGYMHGSAAVIGLQTLPILEPLAGMRHIAAAYAVDLGLAFQLTNFIRDVGDDLRRGRLYLPLDDLGEFGISRDELEAGHVSDRFRALLDFEIARARGLYRDAANGIRLLHPTSRDCIGLALEVYSSILDEVERAGYRVLDRRVSVGTGRRAMVAGPAFVRAWLSRRPHHIHHARV
jgi:phytoene synthase